MDSREVTLYGITEELKAIEETVIDSGGEITPEAEEALKGLEVLLQEKTDGVVGFATSQVDFIEKIDKRIAELQALKTRTTNGLTRFNEYVINCMMRMEKKKIEGNMTSITLPKPRTVVEITDENALPVDMLNIKEVTTKKPNKTKIKEHLEAGNQITGARLSTSKQSIKYKG